MVNFLVVLEGQDIAVRTDSPSAAETILSSSGYTPQAAKIPYGIATRCAETKTTVMLPKKLPKELWFF